MASSFDFAAFILVLYDVCAAGDYVPGCLGEAEPAQETQETQKRQPKENRTNSYTHW